MANRKQNPANYVINVAAAKSEVEALDALIRSIRMTTGEHITRSSLVRSLVVERLRAAHNP